MTPYQSAHWISSETFPGVRYLINQMSLGRKIELTRQIREIGSKVEFLEASGDPREQLQAAALVGEIEGTYILWGLAAVEGLDIDGESATPSTLLSKGPFSLAMEILRCIKSECGLTETERKN